MMTSRVDKVRGSWEIHQAHWGVLQAPVPEAAPTKPKSLTDHCSQSLYFRRSSEQGLLSLGLRTLGARVSDRLGGYQSRGVAP